MIAAPCPIFYSINRNKKSFCLDLHAPEARSIVEGLAAGCDILVENFRPGVMENIGLSYERLARGKLVDISLLDAQISMLAFQVTYLFNTSWRKPSGAIYIFQKRG